MVINTVSLFPDLLVSYPKSRIPECLICETNIEIETSLTFSSTNAEYLLLTSNSQLIGYDYSFWKFRCSGKLLSSACQQFITS